MALGICCHSSVCDLDDCVGTLVNLMYRMYEMKMWVVSVEVLELHDAEVEYKYYK